MVIREPFETTPESPAPATIRAGSSNDFDAVEQLWIALYEHQRGKNMLLEVTPENFKDWSSSMKAALGRFSCLYVAERNGGIVAFLAGRIRTLPPYFGGFPVGFISDVFVAEEHRKLGIARGLLAAATDWFGAQKVRRVELQVLLDNIGARKVYRDLGWKEELVQMVWQIEDRK